MFPPGRQEQARKRAVCCSLLERQQTFEDPAGANGCALAQQASCFYFSGNP
jgi:hypothetical protein